jgi:hypothetical protein
MQQGEAKISGRCWVAYLDIYGFSSHVEKRGEEYVYGSLLRTMENIRSIVEQHGLQSLHLSDSLIVVAFDGGAHGQNSLIAIRECIADVQDELLNDKFIPRGCLAYGSIEMSPRIIVGSALIRAVKLEQQLSTPCVLVPRRELGAGAAPSDFSYNVELKDGGLIQGWPIPPRTIQLLKDAHQEQMEDCLVNGPPPAASALKNLEELILAYEKHQANYRRPSGRSSRKSPAAMSSK